MAAAYEEFLKRIQEGLKKEEEREEAEKEREVQESKNIQNSQPKLSSERPPSEADEEELPDLPEIEDVPEPEPQPEPKKNTQPTSFKELYDEICQQIRASGTLDILMQDFRELKSDLDKVTYVSQLTEIENLVVGENYSQKNHDDACNYEKVYDLLIPNEASASKALDVMKKCIQKTPHEETSALATRYMKRGWAFLLLEQFDHASVDAKKSLSFGVSEEDLWNSYETLGHVNAQKKNYKGAEHNFLKALENLRKSNTVNEVKATVTVRIMTVFKTIKGKKNKKSAEVKNSEKDINKLPEISYGVHKTFPSASAALDFIVTKDRGRCVIANRDIKTGDVLMVDSPYCTMMNPDFLTSHCYNCYKRAPTPIPCNSCAKVSYCCEECRVASWNSLHGMECKVLNHLIEPGIGKMALLAFRVLNILTLPKLQKLQETMDSITKSELKEATVMEEEALINPAEPMVWEGTYSPKDYKTVLHLACNSTKRSFGDLFKRSITAVYLSKCLKVAGYFSSGDCTEEDMLFVASMLLRHIQGGSCNAYEISEFELSSKGLIDAKSLEVGGALYTTISLTNHACTSNVTRYSIGDKCVLRAIRSIPKGSEIFDNYGFHYYLSTVNERQEILQNQYKFLCKCTACEAMWSMYPHHPTETLIFRCPAPTCGQACCYSNTSRSKCNRCGNNQQYAKLLKEFEAQLTRYKEGLRNLKEGNINSCIPIITNHIEFLDKHVILPIKHYSDTQEAIKQCYNYQGNIYKPTEPAPIPEPQPQQQKSLKLKAGKSKFVNPNRQ